MYQSRTDIVAETEKMSFIAEDVRALGYAIVENVLTKQEIDETIERLYDASSFIERTINGESLHRRAELGVLRLLPAIDPFFLKFLQIPLVVELIDELLSPTAIMHLQNGLVLPSLPTEKTPHIFQNTFHQDFRRVLNGYRVSINMMFALSDFSSDSGCTIVVPGSHQLDPNPDENWLASRSKPVECPAGSLIVFDSTLWHAAGKNVSGEDRLAINHQFVLSYLKQQMDYCRAIQQDVIVDLPERTKQLLGYFTRVPTDLADYYKPENERLYRPGQD